MFNFICLGTRDLARAARLGLAAKSWEQVDAFHAAALSHGGTSEGEPGLRVHY